MYEESCARLGIDMDQEPSEQKQSLQSIIVDARADIIPEEMSKKEKAKMEERFIRTYKDYIIVKSYLKKAHPEVYAQPGQADPNAMD